MSTPPRAAPGVAVVPVALLFALLAGAGELGVLAVRKLALGRMVWTGLNAVFVVPLSYAAFTLPGALALALLARLWPRVVRPALALAVLAFVPAFSVLFLFYPALHRLAVLVLALGVAVQAARALEPRRAALNRAARRAVAVALPALLVLGGGTVLWRRAAERRTIAALPAAASGAPDVILVVLDAVRAQNLGAYGYDRPTSPAMDRLAARGVRFRYALSTTSWTLPSHASLLTGRWPHQMRAGWLAPLEPQTPTLARVLAARGYATAGFVANVGYTSRETGLARDFAHYDDFRPDAAAFLHGSSLGRIVVHNPRLRAAMGWHDLPGRRLAGDLVDAFLRWRTGVGDRPVFAFFNLYDAHEPYLPPPPFDTLFGSAAGRRNDLVRVLNPYMAERAFKEEMSEAERRAEMAAYDGAIAYIDRALERLFADLERRGRLANAVVVVTADHGELFGEHGLFSHGNSLWLPSLHVPLIIAHQPGVPAGRVVEPPVSLRDVPATVLALLGDRDDTLPGHDLGTLWRGGGGPVSPAFAEIEPAPNQDPRYPSTLGTMRALLADGYHYIRDGAGREQLYSLADDAQTADLASRPDHAAVLARLRAAVDSLAALR